MISGSAVVTEMSPPMSSRRFDGKEGRCEMCEVRCPSNRGGTDADVVTRTSFENPSDVLVRDLVLCMVDQ